MKVLDAMSFRKQFGAVMDEVFYKKEPVIVERRGQKKVMIVPIDNIGLYELDEDELGNTHKKLIDEVRSMEKQDLLNI